MPVDSKGHLEELTERLARIKPPPTPKSETIYKICGIALYPVWGLLSSSMWLNAAVLQNAIARAAVGIVLAGLLPVVLHIYEASTGKESFDWKTILISFWLGGIVTVFLGSVLQGVLLVFGIHHVWGLRIDRWYWQFPQWMFQG